MALSKAEILDALSRKPRLVEIEGLGEVYIVPMSGRQRQAWSKAVLDDKSDAHYAKMVAECVVDDNGSRVFDDNEAEQLIEGNGEVLQSLFVKVLDVSGLWSGSVDEAKKN